MDESILFDIDGRWRIKLPKPFNIAVTSQALLRKLDIDVSKSALESPYLGCSSRKMRSLSSKPEASASRFADASKA